MCLHLSVYERNKIIIETDFTSFHFILFSDYFFSNSRSTFRMLSLSFVLFKQQLTGENRELLQRSKFSKSYCFYAVKFSKNEQYYCSQIKLSFTFENECSVKRILQFIVRGQRRYGLLISFPFCWSLFILNTYARKNERLVCTKAVKYNVQRLTRIIYLIAVKMFLQCILNETFVSFFSSLVVFPRTYSM